MKILLAVDGSPCSDAAVNEVARRPWPAGSEIKVVSAVEPAIVPAAETWVLPESYMEQVKKAAQDQARAAIDKAAQRLRASPAADLQIATEVIEGYPKYVIPEEAERWEADLIVVGSHGYRGLKRLWLGSVSHAVVSHAKCSVAIVRCVEDR